ncbi:lipopolysaccharide heptosyltransferase I [Parachitinimonas caeni]|uniref:Lipopolysaccharide heptosyltransferase 1 n=1 Tax=Parachitinimonas caeni TaxID=3031301 RepID=A0ABT7DSH9_9NEIS|nr:lipopolysaccharide heptosyltransferase I [Parachitinimonas caeni]MDK2123022.1 lipopolysaccharide heptosyltransferase I [Parachitinimonas caeni]
MRKILLLRLSSMGDIIHNMPAVTDLAQHLPQVELHWVVEEGFAELPLLHPAVTRVFPFALRRWRKSLLTPSSRAEMRALVSTLRAEHYDLVIDSQGLLKSALLAKLTKAPSCGYDRASSREALASLFYQKVYEVPWDINAVERYRQLTAKALGYKPLPRLDYGLQAPVCDLPWRPDGPYAVLLTATSRDDKLWSEPQWLELGRWMNSRGVRAILPWGNVTEQQRAERIASALPNAVVPPRLSLGHAARLLADARLVVGVDTGLVHLAAALAIPTLAIYCASDPARTGVLADSFAINLGKIGVPPTAEQVIAEASRVLS